ncbi:MAG: hypothetical protein A3J74_05135 [Elusimicrobia bacterium RIFCSPHIGHO2_02_FULL_57_9]|nr:MAG: hypothetical protein A3J74_05135 [Elusimicrobia bacterium RIFCSPHIGHO2_02_FULL_57_9]
MVKCLGIFRERQNSPNRQTDDALILKAVMEQLQIQRFETFLMEPQAADREDLNGWDMIVAMCETYPRLMRLKELANSGRLIVNPPEAVLGCYRVKMMEAFRRAPGLLYPETEIRPTAAPFPLDAFSERGVWIKRGDVHNTCDHDVVFALSWDEAESVRRDFERREISSLLLQRHIDGDLIKFYGVGPGQWFTWFYHDPQTARKLPFEIEDLAVQAETAAKAVGLEIFGGDAIISSEGPVTIIDINSWPSFARVRNEASVQIARRLRARLRQAQIQTTQDRLNS